MALALALTLALSSNLGLRIRISFATKVYSRPSRQWPMKCCYLEWKSKSTRRNFTKISCPSENPRGKNVALFMNTFEYEILKATIQFVGANNRNRQNVITVTDLLFAQPPEWVVTI